MSINPARPFLLLILLGQFLFFNSFTNYPVDLDADVLRYTNQLRKANGLAPLVMRNDLNAIARKHSEDMARGKRSFGHGGFDQRYDKMKKIFKSCLAAENVAYGVNTGKDVVAFWNDSGGHRRNMLGNYTYMGIGTARDANGRIYYTQLLVR